MKCPRCPEADLFQQGLQEVVVDVCPNCRGMWLDRGEFERLGNPSGGRRGDRWDRREGRERPHRRSRWSAWLDLFD